MYIINDTVTNLAVFAVYIPACPILFYWLIRKLPKAFQFLSIGALAIQLFLVSIALFHEPTSSYEEWFWHIGLEWNLTSMLSSAQLALVGFVALFAAGKGRGHTYWHCLYLLGIAFFFLVLALVEHFGWKSSSLHKWFIPYFLAASLLAIITVIYIETSARKKRLWLLYLFVAGIAIAAGGVVLDLAGNFCSEFANIFVFDGCLNKALLEECLEFFGGWVALVAILGHFSDPLPDTRTRRAIFIFPAIWVVFLYFAADFKPISEQTGLHPANIESKTNVKLHAYEVQQNIAHLDIFLWLSFPHTDIGKLAYSIHLVDPVSGKSIAKLDRTAVDDLGYRLGPGYTLAYLQWAELNLPSQIMRNQMYQTVFSLWRDEGEGFMPLVIEPSDHIALSDSQIVLEETVFPAPSSETAASEPIAVFPNGFTLTQVEYPARVKAGDSVLVSMAWRAELEDSQTYIQFLHIGNEETGLWHVYDQEPLGQRLPTRLWYSGLADSETWEVPLPYDFPPGSYKVFTGLYRSQDKERVTATNSDGAQFKDARIPLGALMVQSSE